MAGSTLTVVPELAIIQNQVYKTIFAFMVGAACGREEQQGVPKDGEEGRQQCSGRSALANSKLMTLLYQKPLCCLKSTLQRSLKTQPDLTSVS